MGQRRDTALDIMRGLAVVLMVEIHSLIHFRPVGEFYHLLLRALGALAAPFFLIVAGMGMEYLSARWSNEPDRFRRAMLRRGLFLLVFATSLHAYRLDFATLFDWNIFALIGAWYLLSSPLAGVPWRLAVGIILGVMALNVVLPIGRPWILRDGSFPPVPFSVYFLLGGLLVKGRPILAQQGRLFHWCVAGSLLVVIWRALTSIDLTRITRFDVWSLKGIVTISALFMLLISSLWQIDCEAKWPRKVFWPLLQMGKLAFSLYYVQFFFLLLLPGAVRIVTHRDILMVFSNQIWTLLMLGFLALLCGVVAIWERFEFRFSLEWFMSKFVSQRSRIQEQQRTAQ